MGLLINVLITFVVIILVLYLVNLLPIDGRSRQIVRVVVVIIGILVLLRDLSVL
ncbi:MAG TPA: Thivi_2564 family membrane protein [Xanthobacteraceae bacterium]|nr:Thivi_2564 family membrane protein [Xanthobacteraceae bacterium]